MWQSLRRGRARVFLVRLWSAWARIERVDRLHYQWLARQFVQYYEDHDEELEHCAVFTYLNIYFVPNRAEDPNDHFVIWTQDIMPSVRPKIIGVMHSHPPDGTDGPSPGDYDHLPEGKIGGVWKHHSAWVDFFDGKRPIYSVRIK